MKSKFKIILFKILKSKPKPPPTLTLSVGLYYFNIEKLRSIIGGGGVNDNILFVILIKWALVYSFFFQMNEILVIWKFKKHQNICSSIVVFLKCLKKWKTADFWLLLQINKSFVALEQQGSTRNDTFSWSWPRIPKIKKKVWKVQILVSSNAAHHWMHPRLV